MLDHLFPNGVPALIHILYTMLFLIFINRYLIGPLRNFLVQSKEKKVDTALRTEWPTVTTIVPCYNEGETVYFTAKSLFSLDYPAENLEVIIVNDCSTDETPKWLEKAQQDFPDLTVVHNEVNKGKRQSIAEQTRVAKGDFILSVDSDTEVAPQSLKALMNGFSHDNIAAVGGHVYVRNIHESWLANMQAIKYVIGYWLLKGMENASGSVMCLSGCLTLYRKEILIELEGPLMCREFLDIPIKYGEDRYLTRMIVTNNYNTRIVPDAHCYTEAPPFFAKYWQQQLRWRRSNISDLFYSLFHFHKYDPIAGIHVFLIQAMLIVYPLAIIHMMLSGATLAPVAFHLFIGIFSISLYEIIRATKLEKHRFPSGFWVFPLFLLLPIQYLLLNPLALFTMDDSVWGSRTPNMRKQEKKDKV